MTDYTHTPIGSGYNTASQINTELSGIEAAIDSKLDSDGGFVTAPIDMNSQKLLNLPDGTQTGDSVNYGQLVNRAAFQEADAKYYDTMLLATADSTLNVGDVAVIKDRANGIFDVVTVGTTANVDLPNTYNIVVSTATPTICLALRVQENVTASQFGSTAAALQAVIDYAIASDYATVTLDREFDITGSTLEINKGVIHTEGGNDFARKRLTFEGKGVGEILKTDAGFMFSAASGRNGDIAFNNVTFSGVIDNTGVSSIVTGLYGFDCDKLIRLNTTNCTFRYLDYCYYQTGTTATAMQSVKSTNNTYTKNNVILSFNNSWDIVFNGGLMEDGNKFLTCTDVNSTTRNLTVNNGCTIEGMIDTAIELNCVNYGTKVINSYFEANQNHIQMNRFNGAVSISNNSFLGRGGIDAGDTIKCIDVAVGEQGITVDGNISTETNTNTILISVDEASAFNSARYNIMGTNVTLGSTITDTPLRVLDKANLINDTTRGVEFGITADVSSVQGGGALTATINEISTCANVGDAVTLLPAVSGLRQTIINNGANACDVFPNTGDNLGVGANTAVSLAAGANITYVCYDFATNWVALT